MKKRVLGFVLSVAILCSMLLSGIPVMAADLIESITVSPTDIHLWLDFDLDCTPAAIVSPETADASAIKWVSSDTSVATIDEVTGSITLVKEGTTNITAVATDGSNVVSTPMVLTVTAPENRAANQLVSLGSATEARINPAEHIAWPEDIGQGVIAEWNDNKIGAYTITVDDSISDDFDKWMAWTEEYGFPFTFFVPTLETKYYKFISQWNELKEAGEAVQSHSYHHYSDTELAALSTAEVIKEYQQPVDYINDNVYGGAPVCRTMALSYGTGKYDYVKKFYIAARGVSGKLNNPAKTNYTSVGSISLNGSIPFDRMYNSVYNLLDPESEFYGGWTSIHSHGLDYTAMENPDLQTLYPDRTKFYPSEVMKHTIDAYIYPNRDKIWVDTFVNVAMYGQERDTATLTVTESTPSSIKFNITDMMDDTLFDYPLTVKFMVDNDWEDIKAYQNGSEVDVTPVTVEGTKYILVKAVPDRGEVSVIPEFTAPTDPIESLEISYTGSLNQVIDTASEITFTVVPTPTENVRPNTVEWYVNDEATTTRGYNFTYTPSRAGEYRIYAKVYGSDTAVSDTVTINVAKATPVVTAWPTVKAIGVGQKFADALNTDGIGDGTFVIEDADVYPEKNEIGYSKYIRFIPSDTDSYYEITSPVPVTVVVNDLVAVEDNVVIYDDFETGNTLNTTIKGWTVYGNCNAVDDNGNIVASYTRPANATATTTDQVIKNIPISASPLVLSGMIKYSGFGGQVVYDVSIRSQANGSLVRLLQIDKNGKLKLINGATGNASYTYGATLATNKWLKYSLYLEPVKDADGKLTKYVLTAYLSGEALGSNTNYVVHSIDVTSFGDCDYTSVASKVIYRASVPKDATDAVYGDNYKVYFPGSFVMDIKDNTDVATDAEVRLQFNHDVNVNTLAAEKITVSDASGNTVAVKEIKYDLYTPSYCDVTLDGKLKAGTNYYVALSPDVVDITGQSVIARAMFTTQKGNDILYGDVTGDGNINALDRANLSRYIAKWDAYPTLNNTDGADVNKDGNINALDRAMLSRYVAKWDGYETF